nr:MAG TPA: hypothetical protein [Caudoviricetes sp.]
MLIIEKTETYGWEAAIRGMRNPLNSWNKSDSYFKESNAIEYCNEVCEHKDDYCKEPCFNVCLGENDQKLMKKLAKAGTDHRKYLRMITVSCDITAPLYWWKEFDTYKIGTVANSCSTMHKIHAKEFTLDDFSCEHLLIRALNNLNETIELLNMYRDSYIELKKIGDTSKDAKTIWWQMIQLLPSSYNQKRTVMLNYEVLANIYKSRKNHKLDEWHVVCDWIKTLPCAELITGEDE